MLESFFYVFKARAKFIALLALFPALMVMSAEDGKVGTQSTGKFQIKLRVKPTVQIYHLKDIAFAQQYETGMGSSIKSPVMDFAMYSNDGGKVTLTFESEHTHSGGMFNLVQAQRTEVEAESTADKTISFKLNVYDKPGAKGNVHSVDRNGARVVFQSVSDKITPDPTASIVVETTGMTERLDSGEFGTTMTVTLAAG